MRAVSILAVALLGAVVVFGAAPETGISVTYSDGHAKEARAVIMQLSSAVSEGKPGSLCQICVSAAVAMINYVLNALANGVVIGSCNKLCAGLPKKDQGVCELACDLVGIKEIIKLINETDPDPIYICDKVNQCIRSNCTSDCVDIDSMASTPAEGPVDTTFNVAAAFTVNKPLGSGMTRIQVHFPPTEKTEPLQNDQLNVQFAPGKYTANIQVPTTPAPPDPNGPPPPMWVDGVYTVELFICDGSCGSKHFNPNVLSAQNTTFTITNGPAPPPGPPGPPGPPPAPGSKFYEDPNAGPCSGTETAVQITGVKGSFCSPTCSASSPCPGAPAGATAKPQCVLEKPPSQQPSQCALICSPLGSKDQCPPKASCKKIQSTGLCTYDT